MHRSLITAAALLTAAPWALGQDALQSQNKSQNQSQNLARNLAATCANCHGTDGRARGEVKPLAGVSAGRITAMWADFKSGAVPATVMHQIAKGYSDEQIRLIAGYFAAQPAAK